MFTGIVTDVGEVREVEAGGDTRFEIKTAYETASIQIGASIACDGACLTVIETGADWFAVSASAETLEHTALDGWKAGQKVNLERHCLSPGRLSRTENPLSNARSGVGVIRSRMCALCG